MAPINPLLDEIRGRRQITAAQAISMLDLVPAADVEMKRSFLSMAARSLIDPGVLEKWIDVALKEDDISIKGEMANRLFGMNVKTLGPINNFVALQISLLSHSDYRKYSILILSQLILELPEVSATLISLYKEQTSRDTQRYILLALGRFVELPSHVLEFFIAHVNAVDQDMKLMILDRILRQDAAPMELIESCVALTEPPPIKWRVINYLIDRALSVEEKILLLIQKDPDPIIRRAAVRAFAVQSVKSNKGIEQLLESLQKDSDPDVRQMILHVFYNSIDLNENTLSIFINALKGEPNRQVVFYLLGILRPHASRSVVVRDGLLHMLNENLHINVATAVVETLGQMVKGDPALYEAFLESYKKSSDDKLKGHLLKVLSQSSQTDPRLLQILRDALGSPDVAIRSWGGRGLLMLPMEISQTEEVGRGVVLLLDDQLEISLRRDLSAKISRIPNPSPELKEALKTAAEKSSDEIIKKNCFEAIQKIKTASPSQEVVVDVEGWYRQVEVDHQVAGIFPEIYGTYDTNPAGCLKILKVALLNPQCHSSMRENPTPVQDIHIIQFLASRRAIDDDISRYLVDKILTANSDINKYLAALSFNLKFNDLSESLIKILEKWANSHELNPVLLREVWIKANGNSDNALKVLKEKILSITTPDLAMPYFKFIADNLGWLPIKDLLPDLIKQKHLLNEENNEILEQAIETWIVSPRSTEAPPSSSGPGLADD